MEFLKLNYKKIALRFLLNVVISFFIILFLGLSRHESFYVDLKIKRIVFIVLPILISFITVGLNYMKFIWGRKSLRNESLNEIKSIYNNQYQLKDTNTTNIFNYSFKCLLGKINDFPCSIAYELDIYPSYRATRCSNYILCRFTITNKFNQDKIDEYQIPIHTTFKGLPTKDVKQDILNYTETLKQKFKPAE